jgi:hypothetical protein
MVNWLFAIMHAHVPNELAEARHNLKSDDFVWPEHELEEE